MMSSFKVVKFFFDMVRRAPEHMQLIRRVNDPAPRRTLIGF